MGLDWPRKWWTVRFVEEPFLTEGEWRAYLNELPVRYTAKDLKRHRPAVKCEVCGGPPIPGNPLEAAHLIPFARGIQHLALTPHFLNDSRRLRWAHKRACNNEYGLSELVEVLEYLRAQGIKKLPSFLRQEVLRTWESLPDL